MKPKEEAAGGKQKLSLGPSVDAEAVAMQKESRALINRERNKKLSLENKMKHFLRAEKPIAKRKERQAKSKLIKKRCDAQGGKNVQ